MVLSKKLENDIILRNKEKVIAKEFNQLEDKYFNERYAYVAKFESIRIMFDFSYILNFKLFQLAINILFLNKYIQEEVYVDEPPKFKIFSFLNHVFSYDHLRKLLLENIL